MEKVLGLRPCRTMTGITLDAKEMKHYYVQYGRCRALCTFLCSEMASPYQRLSTARYGFPDSSGAGTRVKSMMG